MFGVLVVQIIKFKGDLVTFENKGTCYSINSETEFSFQEIAEFTGMTFKEVKMKYDLIVDSDDH